MGIPSITAPRRAAFLPLHAHFMPGMETGDVMGHEFMGEVVEVGTEVKSALRSATDGLTDEQALFLGDISES